MVVVVVAVDVNLKDNAEDDERPVTRATFHVFMLPSSMLVADFRLPAPMLIMLPIFGITCTCEPICRCYLAGSKKQHDRILGVTSRTSNSNNSNRKFVMSSHLVDRVDMPPFQDDPLIINICKKLYSPRRRKLKNHFCFFFSPEKFNFSPKVNETFTLFLI